MAVNGSHLAVVRQVNLVSGKNVDEVLFALGVNHVLELSHFSLSLLEVICHVDDVNRTVSFTEEFGCEWSLLGSLEPNSQMTPRIFTLTRHWDCLLNEFELRYLRYGPL